VKDAPELPVKDVLDMVGGDSSKQQIYKVSSKGLSRNSYYETDTSAIHSLSADDGGAKLISMIEKRQLGRFYNPGNI
ncbi:hypothetical protein, partial [Pseudomonas sp. FW306-2-11AC]|uniref:hypothetical protein n=1 Tax=Pseudomonas sp. FW306-2-11AC TaxID=2070656 RepID=UPI001C462603